MIGLKFNKAKGMFFDRAKVTSAVDSATRKVLSRFGAYVRQTAKNSIRKRRKPAPPGSPPSSHTGLLRKFIFFGYDPAKQSVVIGPAALNAKNTGAPKTLEHGGATTIEVGKQKKRVTIQARPFMGPAYEKEKPKLPQMWQDSVK
jgi:hypothetical protein